MSMNQTAIVGHEPRAAGTGEWGDFVTVQEGAAFLHISQSTVWRRVKAGDVRAYRLGGRRVWLRRTELAGLVKPATESTRKGGTMAQGERVHERRLTEAERQQMLEAVEAARELRAKLLEARGGKLFRPAYEDINEAGQERSAARG
jgi:excisionase family DNA binding protein